MGYSNDMNSAERIETGRKMYRAWLRHPKGSLHQEEERGALCMIFGHQDGATFIPATLDEVRRAVGLD